MKVSVTTLATWTGLHRDTIRRRLAPILTGQHGEQVDSTKALPLLYSDSERLDPAQEKARLDKVRREKETIELKARQRELLEVSDMLKIIDIAATSCRDHMMGIPSRWADVLAGESDSRTIESILDREIRDGLERISQDRARFG